MAASRCAWGTCRATDSQASLEYAFPEGGQAYSLDIYARPTGEQPTSGEFRLLAGVDAPEVISGTAEPNSQEVLRLPTEVQAGLKLQQIVMIDQSNEIMTAVGTIKLAWKDPKLAFSPDECNCQVKEYTENNFNQFLTETGGDWPDFTFFNQQGNRWALNRVVDVHAGRQRDLPGALFHQLPAQFRLQPVPVRHGGFLHPRRHALPGRPLRDGADGGLQRDRSRARRGRVHPDGFRYLGQQRDLQPRLPDLALHLPLQRPAPPGSTTSSASSSRSC